MAEEYDYHFLILSPDLQGAWFTQGARGYWLKFQPVVTDNPELLSFTPPDASVAVTLVTRSATAEQAKRKVGTLRKDLYLDVITADDLPQLESILERRAQSESRFGDRTEERA